MGRFPAVLGFLRLQSKLLNLLKIQGFEATAKHQSTIQVAYQKLHIFRLTETSIIERRICLKKKDKAVFKMAFAIIPRGQVLSLEREEL